MKKPKLSKKVCSCSCHQKKTKKSVWRFNRKQSTGCSLCTDWYSTQWHNGKPVQNHIEQSLKICAHEWRVLFKNVEVPGGSMSDRFYCVKCLQKVLS